MTIQPKGYQEILERMSQLQAKIDGCSSRPPGLSAPKPSPFPEPQSGSGFEAALQGAIGKHSGELAPMDPMKLGVMPASSGKAQLQEMARAAAARHGIDPAVFESLVEQESSFNPSEVSSKGAVGLTQLMPETAASLGVKNPMDPAQNLDAGARFLQQMMRSFGGDTSLALAAYNAGPGAVRRHGGIPPFPETQNYVRKIMSMAEAARTK